MRIATWNLERPRKAGHARNALLREQMHSVNADIWVLTEASSALFLPGYDAASTDSVKSYHLDGEVSTAILTRWPISRTIQTWDSQCAVCAEVAAPAGPLIVYGTIITYANDKGPTGTARRWEEHRRSIGCHRQDWLALKSSISPEGAVIVAGDFNQSRDGSGWYEDRTSVDLLSDALDRAGLVCVTEQDFRKSHGLSRASIDHICISERLTALVSGVCPWEGVVAGRKVSDHNGVFIDVDA